MAGADSHRSVRAGRHAGHFAAARRPPARCGARPVWQVALAPTQRAASPPTANLAATTLCAKCLAQWPIADGEAALTAGDGLAAAGALQPDNTSYVALCVQAKGARSMGRVTWRLAGRGGTLRHHPHCTESVLRRLICAAPPADEHSHIREWVLYHHLIGAGQIYVFDDASEPPMQGVLQASRTLANLCAAAPGAVSCWARAQAFGSNLSLSNHVAGAH